MALENANKVLSDIQRIFNTGPYGDPLKNQNFENMASSCFKLGLEPTFHDPGTFGGFGKCEQKDTHKIHVL